VPVQNSLLFANAMTKAGVPFELHVFPKGPHGLALCNAQTAHGEQKYLVPHNECWIDLAISWVRDFEL
jgi:acetyl esterase/lipase